MNTIKREETFHYFAEQTAHFKELSQSLAADQRNDEAVFAKIRMNVYDIFHAVFGAAVKTCGDDDEKVLRFFLTRLQQIPGSWHTALTAARQHNETEKAHIESIKLEAAAGIREAICRIWEVEA